MTNSIKKTAKKVVVVTVVGFSMIGAGTTVSAAAGYLQWGGTGARNSTLQTLKEIGTEGKKLKSDRDSAKQQVANKQTEVDNKQKEVDQKQKEVDEKNNIIDQKNQTIDQKVQEVEAQKQEVIKGQQEIDRLNNSTTETKGQLDQAVTDMKGVDKAAKDALEELK